MKRRRHMQRDEVAAELSATHDLPLDQIDAVLDGLAGMGVDLAALVTFVVDEPDPTIGGEIPSAITQGR